MTTTRSAPAAVALPIEGPLTKRADLFLLAGCLACGSGVLGPVGLGLIIWGMVGLRRAAAAGERQRPLAVTVLAVFALADAGINFGAWALDIFANSTHLMQALTTGYGRLFDGGYYMDYRTMVLGGAGGAGEKGWGVFAVTAVFPLRVVAIWAFLKMKRWGFDFMLLTTWVYTFAWLGYLTNVLQNFDVRFGAAQFGVAGWWFINFWYLTPFVMLPWLYALNRNKWNR